MKQVNVTVSFEEEKLNALKRYMAKKDLEPERELRDALLKLYEKYVPAPVREYIDESDVPKAANPRPRQSQRSAPAKSAEQPPVTSATEEVRQHE